MYSNSGPDYRIKTNLVAPPLPNVNATASPWENIKK
jgi:hypothetical protein